jgi:hypothetical protein
VNKELLCKIGMHDKELVGDGLLCSNYIKRCLYKEKPIDSNEVQATRDFFINNDADIIYRDVYSGPRTLWALDRVVQDYVCIRCCKCFENIKHEKMYIEDYVLRYLEKKKNKEIRKQMAIDLYRENCEEY